MILFEPGELVKYPIVLQKIFQHGFQIYFKIDDPSETHRLLEIEVRYDNLVIATAEFEADDGEGHCNIIDVWPNYQRKGIANALYVFAEYSLECILENFWDKNPIQTDPAKYLWLQKDRPFGNPRL
jgi:GNAT superfamily N-acetyltransferase